MLIYLPDTDKYICSTINFEQSTFYTAAKKAAGTSPDITAYKRTFFRLPAKLIHNRNIKEMPETGAIER
ncbi:hypothetical protein GCM10027516_01260 [Niabella aquatica]